MKEQMFDSVEDALAFSAAIRRRLNAQHEEATRSVRSEEAVYTPKRWGEVFRFKVESEDERELLQQACADGYIDWTSVATVRESIERVIGRKLEAIEEERVRLPSASLRKTAEAMKR